MTTISLPVFCIVALAFFNQLVCFGSPIESLSTKDFKDIIENLAENDRYQFITKNMQLGYNIQELKQPWPNKEEADLAVQIFKYVARNQQVTDNGRKIDNSAMLRDQICLPPPVGCFDPNDPSIRPGIKI